MMFLLNLNRVLARIVVGCDDNYTVSNANQFKWFWFSNCLVQKRTHSMDFGMSHVKEIKQMDKLIYLPLFTNWIRYLKQYSYSFVISVFVWEFHEPAPLNSNKIRNFIMNFSLFLNVQYQFKCDLVRFA